MYNEGLYNKLDKSTQKLKPSKQNTQQKLGLTIAVTPRELLCITIKNKKTYNTINIGLS